MLPGEIAKYLISTIKMHRCEPGLFYRLVMSPKGYSANYINRSDNSVYNYRSSSHFLSIRFQIRYSKYGPCCKR